VLVAHALLEAAHVAKRIRDAMQSAEGSAWAEYLDFFPNLNSVAASGQAAIRKVTEQLRLDDPFAFVNQPAASDKIIDTTPTMPKPPLGLVDSAMQAIPSILANVEPRQDAAIELVASELVEQLRGPAHAVGGALGHS
jgi:hypothetical protein